MMPGYNISFTVKFMPNPLYIAAAVILVKYPAEIPLLCKGAEQS
jgi:hypothetical protein